MFYCFYLSGDTNNRKTKPSPQVEVVHKKEKREKSPSSHNNTPTHRAVSPISSSGRSWESMERENENFKEQLAEALARLRGYEELMKHSTDSSLLMLQGENDKLKKQLHISTRELRKENEKLGEQLQKLGTLDISNGVEVLERENRKLKEKLRDFEYMERESAEMMDQLAIQHDEILGLKQEKASLLATLQLMQDELTTSEQMRRKPESKTPVSHY